MNELSYTFAVARIRANEPKLLTGNELNALVGLKSYREILKKLNEKGYAFTEEEDTAPKLAQRIDEAWKLLCELLPERHQFDSRIILNDFANLKALTKAFVCQKEPDSLLITPCVYPVEEVKKAVFDNDNEKLPEILRHAHRSAYRILTKTQFAQLSDTVIDRNGLEAAIRLAKSADNGIMLKLAESDAALADIKVLYRCIKTQKAESFIRRAVLPTDLMDVNEAVSAALRGTEELERFLLTTPFAMLTDAMHKSPVAFERACDDEKMKLLQQYKWEPFGIAPLVCYWDAVLTEVKNVRILLAAKKNGLSAEAISERMRLLYV